MNTLIRVWGVVLAILIFATPVYIYSVEGMSVVTELAIFAIPFGFACLWIAWCLPRWAEVIRREKEEEQS
jgi:hypothetical protein